METIPLFKVHMPQTIKDPLMETLFSGFVGQGPKVDEFESKLAAYFNNKNIVTVNAGTSGLQLALRLANVGYGDEVISTPMTCTATNMPILAAGAKIVWADVDSETGLISPESIESKITPKTKAIMMVHFGGIPCDINAINAIAKKHGIKTIEDGAHALGSEYQGQKIGNHSDFVMFSLQAIKHITTIDGGILICQDNKDFERAKLLRWYGIDRNSPRKDFRCEENIEEYGYKFHMNDIAAVIGIEQLKYVDELISKHVNNAKFYDEHLQDLSKVTLLPRSDDSVSASWLYTIHVTNRDEFMNYMSENNVMTSKVHERNDIHDCFSEFSSDVPGVDSFCESQVSIPVGWWLTSDQLNYIAKLIREF
ncbi:DegT/DnrJ/EryC1/StrS family aminotransferase [Gammaproteobacteria bacterium]|nr:DegT/DnrJ/EryC1/StrS family aminotransferase [Gammaproteobacteria bacterium]